MARPIRTMPRPAADKAPQAPAPIPDKTEGEKVKTDVLSKEGKPFIGKTTAFGRKTEKPGNSVPSGPSGQKEVVQHNRKHTNK